MAILYNFLIYLYYLAILIAALFNRKAKQWIRGRRNIFLNLSKSFNDNIPVILFHAASLGEFEQGRPVIEACRKKFPSHKILLTFFSPSGYEVRKNYEGADYVFYLPLDFRKNANSFINIVKPERVFFIKYEYWYNYLNTLKSKGIPVYILSANFRPSQYFFKWYGSWFRKMLKGIDHIFLQNEVSENLLKEFNITNCSVSGDTRFDRVYEAARNKKPFPAVEGFCGKAKILLMGSSWPGDEVLLYKILNDKIPDIKVIIAPHEVHDSHIRDIRDKLQKPSLIYSELNQENITNAEVLIIDTVGILLHLYQYTTVAYIGGGFGKGIHNILEAAAFGKPVIFGPNFQKFHEASELIRLGGAFSIKNHIELKNHLLDLLSNPEHYKKASKTCNDYIIQQKGATDRIFSELKV